ncbi:alpha/beta hydrolase [Solirubrobacter soli]|uniref:alpha/beta hydrolase n=1 Tax=Solirubrobacter soli TaxID=363832 RepID=UPI0004230D80|nr:alpha/beta hydrolase [Solirubrobacter soli]
MAYRIALDDPEVVKRVAVLDVVPTGEVWRRADASLALTCWHWAFLAQPAPLPERLILGVPDGFWIAARRMGLKPGDPYRTQLGDPGFVTAVCEDYRAGATIDREHDDEGGTIACPVRALWAGEGALPRLYEDPLEPWRAFAPPITGRAVEGASHFLVEDAPDVVGRELAAFF